MKKLIILISIVLLLYLPTKAQVTTLPTGTKPFSTQVWRAPNGDLYTGVNGVYILISGSPVTSVGMTVPTGLTVTGSPITSAGTLALGYASGYQGFTTAQSTKLAGIAAGANNYTLPLMTSTVTGGARLFSNTVQTTPALAVTGAAERTYGVQLNSSNQLVVNVPWVGEGASIPYTPGNGISISSNVISFTEAYGIGTQIWTSPSGNLNTQTHNNFGRYHSPSTVGAPVPGTGNGYYIQIGGITQGGSSTQQRAQIAVDPLGGLHSRVYDISSWGPWVSASGGGGGATSLNDLTNVTIASPTNGQSLVFDGSSGHWKNASSFRLRSNTNSYLTGDVSLSAGSNITLTQSGNTVTINSTGGGSGGGITALTGNVTASGTGSVVATIANGAVSNARMANMAANTIKGRLSSAGAPQDLTPGQVRTLIYNTSTTSTTINMTGARFQRLGARSSNTTLTLSNNTDGATVQVSLNNSGGSTITVSVSGAILVGTNQVNAGAVAVVSISNFGGQTIYSVIN